jgi:glutamate decarboxylase
VRGWVLPAYTMAPNAKNVKLLRAVVREDLSMSMVDELVVDIMRTVEWLDHHHTYTDDQLKELKHTDKQVVPHHRFHVKHDAEHRTGKHPKVKHNAGVC